MKEDKTAAYDKRLKDNLMLLSDENSLQSYPALTRLFSLRNGIYKRMVEALITDCLNTPNRERKPHSNGAEHVYMSSRHLARQHPDVAKTYTTWSTAINLLSCIGLIKVKHPTAKTANTPEEKKAVKIAGQLAREQATTPAGAAPNVKTHAITFVWVEAYTPQQLEYMNESAQKWFDSGRHKARLSKAEMITLYGAKKANAVFGDGRVISDKRQRIIDQMTNVLEDLLQSHQYTTLTAFKAAYRPDHPAAAQRDWRNNSSILLANCKLEYRQQSKSDKERYNIPENERGWIIIHPLSSYGKIIKIF